MNKLPILQSKIETTIIIMTQLHYNKLSSCLNLPICRCLGYDADQDRCNEEEEERDEVIENEEADVDRSDHFLKN